MRSESCPSYLNFRSYVTVIFAMDGRPRGRLRLALLVGAALLVGFVGPDLVALLLRALPAAPRPGVPAPRSLAPDPATSASALDRLPQALLIGVQKSGTSALYFNLCLHPGVACAAVVKEPFYLSQPSTERFIRQCGGLGGRIPSRHAHSPGRALRRHQNYMDRAAQVAFHQAYLSTCFNLSKIQPGQITLEVQHFSAVGTLSVIVRVPTRFSRPRRARRTLAARRRSRPSRRTCRLGNPSGIAPVVSRGVSRVGLIPDLSWTDCWSFSANPSAGLTATTR